MIIFIQTLKLKKMKFGDDFFIIYVFIYIVVLLIVVLILRWTFSVNTHLKNQDEQNRILKEIRDNLNGNNKLK